jgi:DNA mismatch repair protein MutS
MDLYPIVFSSLSHWESFPEDLRNTILRSIEIAENPFGIHINQSQTPMLQQFVAAKENNQDCLVFFRLGDFFELFGTDAIIASHILQITLTSRDKSSSNPVPMAGVPVVTYRNALKKCILQGFKVVVCDQVEDSDLSKTLMTRKIVEVLSPSCPGDLLDDEPILGSFLGSVTQNEKGDYLLSVADLSTGMLKVTKPLHLTYLKEEVRKLSLKELVTSSALKNSLKQEFPYIRISSLPKWIDSETENLSLSYLEYYLKQYYPLLKLQKADVYHPQNFCFIDSVTQRNLELFENLQGKRSNTLFDFMNQTLTPGGGRLLGQRMMYPLRSIDEIEKSLDAVQNWSQNTDNLYDCRQKIRNPLDTEKIALRIFLGSLDPNLYIALKTCLSKMISLKDILHWDKVTLDSLSQLISLFEPINTKECLLSSGYYPQWDELSSLQNQGHIFIEELLIKEQKTLPLLKIRQNRSQGFAFELPMGKAHLAPSHFILIQSLTNCKRYTSRELKALEAKIHSASHELSQLQKEILGSLQKAIVENYDLLISCIHQISSLDMTTSLALVALQNGWSRPYSLKEPVLAIKNAFHPVFKKHWKTYIPNNISFGKLSYLPFMSFALQQDTPILLITGPNMGGKSTLMRQIGVTQVLYQMGSFLPCHEAYCSPCDGIYSRIGSGDDPSQKRSTFMQEMKETADILNFATSQSLLMFDEVGRGTSTSDGMALALSLLEYLYEHIGGRILFSTHYHELLTLTKRFSGIQGMHMEVLENPSPVFTYRLMTGGIQKSYGIHVAKDAGLPASLIQRAQEILDKTQIKLPKG